jgi:Icc-related predicted phosphoesterase
MAENGSLRIAAMGDLHVKEGQSAPFRDLFAEIGHEADVLVLTGDLTDLGKPAEAKILAEDLKACRVPVLGVLGNHDHESGEAEAVTAILRDAGLQLLDGGVCEVGGVGFTGVKGFGGGFGRRMLGAFGEPLIKAFVQETVNEAMRLENGLRKLKEDRAVVVMHYAPVESTVEGEPAEIMPFLGSSRFAETIDRFKVTAVVHGHAHTGRYEGRTPGGTPVFNVARGVPKPNGKAYAVLTI